jgi:diguanylate cyclase (GGDEF)-like protein
MSETLAPRILLIDANPDGHSLFAQALDKTGINFSNAYTSAEGIALASGKHHDLILLDSALPDLNGLLTLRQLRSTTKTAGFPVVFLVGNEEKDLITEAYFEGAVDVLRKPLFLEELQARIKSVLRNQTMLHRLRYLSHNDPTTRIPNRNGMAQWIQRAIENPADFPVPYAALVIGIDRINHVTDLLGHGVTDELLRGVAVQIQSIISNSGEMERCCNRCFLARGSADSFSLLLTGVEGARAVTGLAARLVEVIANDYRFGNQDLYVSASVGIAFTRESHLDFHNLIRFADIALQDARRAGRSHVQMFNPSMEEVLHRKLKVEDDLRLATKKRDLFLEYQPVFNVQTRQCEFAETVISWNREEFGIVPLQPFRSIADENGFTGEIASWALANACSQLSQWQHESAADAPRRLSMDLSRKQLQHPQFIEAALETIQQSGLRNDRIQFEISESDIMQDRDGAIEAMRRLRESGMRILIDEFGISFPSFLAMDQFPVDAIKLSKTLVQNIEANPLVVKLIEILVRQANQYNLMVVGDGIERESQVKILGNLGIRFGQGPCYVESMQGDAMVPFLMDWNRALRNKPKGRVPPTDLGNSPTRNAHL